MHVVIILVSLLDHERDLLRRTLRWLSRILDMDLVRCILVLHPRAKNPKKQQCHNEMQVRFSTCIYMMQSLLLPALAV